VSSAFPIKIDIYDALEVIAFNYSYNGFCAMAWNGKAPEIAVGSGKASELIEL